MQECKKALRSYGTVLLRKWERVIQRLNGKTKDDLPKLLDYDIVEEMGRRNDPLSPLSSADWKTLYEALATFIRRLANMQDRILDENYEAMITMFDLIAGPDHAHDSEYEGVFTKRGTWSVIRSFILNHDPKENLHLMIFFLTLLLRRRSCQCCQITELKTYGDELCAQFQKCFEVANKASPYMKFQLAFCVTGLIVPCLVPFVGMDPREASSYVQVPMVGRLLARYNLLRLAIKVFDPDQSGHSSKLSGSQDLSTFGRYIPLAIGIHKDLYPLSESKEFVRGMIRLLKKYKETMPMLMECLIRDLENLMHAKFFSETFLPQLVEYLPRNCLRDVYGGIAKQIVSSGGVDSCQFTLARAYARAGRFDAHPEVAAALFFACAEDDMVLTREEWDLFHEEFAVPSLQRQYFEPCKSQVSEYIFNKRMLILEDLLVGSWKPFASKLSAKLSCGRSPEIRFDAYPNGKQKYWAMITECEFMTCDQCGYQTVRNGTCLRRLGCGFKASPVGVTVHRNIELDGKDPMTMLDTFKSWTEEPSNSKSQVASSSSSSTSAVVGGGLDQMKEVELGNMKRTLSRTSLLDLQEQLKVFGGIDITDRDAFEQGIKEEYEKLVKYFKEDDSNDVKKPRSVAASSFGQILGSNNGSEEDKGTLSVFDGMADALKYLKADSNNKPPIHVVHLDPTLLDSLVDSIAKPKTAEAKGNDSNNNKSEAKPAKVKVAAPTMLKSDTSAAATTTTLHSSVAKAKQQSEEEQQEEARVVNGTFAMECTYCGRVADDLMLCGRCHEARYCNRTCQKADWKKSHKAECNITSNDGSS